MRRKALPTSDDAYSVSFSVTGALDLEVCDGHRYVIEISGQILHCKLDESGGDEPEPVGSIHALCLRVGDALNHGISIYEACDEHSAEAEDCAALLFQPGTNEFRATVEQTSGELGFESDVLIVLEIKLDPAHRGRRVGQAALLETMRLMGESCALTILKPWPLQYTPKEFESIHKTGRTTDGKTAKDRDHDFEKLRRYWSELGFARLGKSDFYIRSHAHQMPTAADVLNGSFKPARKPRHTSRL